MAEDYKRIKKMADGFIDRIMKELPDVTLNGDREHRWPGNINLSFSCVEGESLIMAMHILLSARALPARAPRWSPPT